MSVIVVGVDGSADAQKALEWAMNEAAAHQAELTALSVVPEPVTAGFGGPVTSHASPDEITHAEEIVKSAVEKANAGRSTAVPVNIEVVGGEPSEALVDAGADMIVVGSRGIGGFSRLLLGSVSSRVAHHATCPVVIVPTTKRPSK